MGVQISKNKVGGGGGGGGGGGHSYTLVSPTPHFCGSLYLNWACVRDRQCDDASWFNYVYNIRVSSRIFIWGGGKENPAREAHFSLDMPLFH